MSTSAALTAVTMLAEVYRAKLSAGMLTLYGRTLADLTEDEVEQMTATCLRSNERFLPPPGVLLEMVRGPQITPEQQANGEWCKLVSAVDGTVGETTALSNRTRYAAKELGGFTYIKKLPNNDLPFERQRFVLLWLAQGTSDQPRISQDLPQQRRVGGSLRRLGEHVAGQQPATMAAEARPQLSSPAPTHPAAPLRYLKTHASDAQPPCRLVS